MTTKLKSVENKLNFLFTVKTMASKEQEISRNFNLQENSLLIRSSKNQLSSIYMKLSRQLVTAGTLGSY